MYFGSNAHKTHKRGVENVIETQSKSFDFQCVYYIHWGERTTAYRGARHPICLSLKNDWFWPVRLNAILFRIKQKQEHLIIHSHNALFSAFLIYRTDILSVHDALYYLDKSKHKRGRLIFYLLEKLLYYRCGWVHFVSRFAMEQSLFGRRTNYSIIPNTSHYEPMSKDGWSWADDLVKKDDFILVVRSIEERAGIDLLIRLAESSQTGGRPVIIAGKGPLLEFYQEQIAQKGLQNIRMLGYVDDPLLLTLYAQCALVLVTATYGEGFGLPVIEGYLFNKPVIASNCCAIPEIIISNDFLFENRVEDMERAIRFALTNRDNYDFRGYYDHRFSNELMMAEYKLLYNKIPE